jgi:hypothetical protein
LAPINQRRPIGCASRSFDGENTSGIERTERSLHSRWGGGGVINADCQKWSRVQKTVDEINPSGYDEFDRVSCVLVDVFICQAFSNMFVPNLFSSLCL